MIYLDFNATTPVLHEVFEVMKPYFFTHFGNAASSTHLYGRMASSAVEEARQKIAHAIGADHSEIYFTSGSTEAVNIGIKGVFFQYGSHRPHIITVATEHKAVLETVQSLQQFGAEITVLPVDSSGAVDPERILASITSRTLLVALMYANNETGFIHPVEHIGKMLHEREVLFFCDTTQAMNTLPVNVQSACISMLCLSAHKLYGPKGAGILYIRRRSPRVQLSPLLHGGGHEKNIRPGTLNVAAIAGMGEAVRLAAENRNQHVEKLTGYRDILMKALEKDERTVIHTVKSGALVNTISFSVRGLKAGDFLRRVPQLALATGSACTSARPAPSHVLRAMNIEEELLSGAVRISAGITCTPEEIGSAAAMLEEALSY